MGRGHREHALARSPDDDRRWLDPDRPERRVVHAQDGVGDGGSPPQDGERAAARLEASHPLGERRERHAGRPMVVASQVPRAGAEADLEPAAARGLGDGELACQQERRPQRRVQDVDRQPDPRRDACHRGEKGRSVPCGLTGGRRAHVIEARDEIEAGFFGSRPGCEELVEGPSPLAGLHPDPHARPLSHAAESERGTGPRGGRFLRLPVSDRYCLRVSHLTKVSLPRPPTPKSLPGPPSSRSLPRPPNIRSLPSPPNSWSLPRLPSSRSAPKPPTSRSAPRPRAGGRCRPAPSGRRSH